MQFYENYANQKNCSRSTIRFCCSVNIHQRPRA